MSHLRHHIAGWLSDIPHFNRLFRSRFGDTQKASAHMPVWAVRRSVFSEGTHCSAPR